MLVGEDIHHQLADALLIVYPPDHAHANLGDLRMVQELDANSLQDLDDPFPDGDGDAGVLHFYLL